VLSTLSCSRRERKWQEMLKNWDQWMPKKREKVCARAPLPACASAHVLCACEVSARLPSVTPTIVRLVLSSPRPNAVTSSDQRAHDCVQPTVTSDLGAAVALTKPTDEASGLPGALIARILLTCCDRSYLGRSRSDVERESQTRCADGHGGCCAAPTSSRCDHLGDLKSLPLKPTRHRMPS
jgi:hypothetical protein